MNVPIDLRQEPAAFPEPTSFRWYKGGQHLTETDHTLTYSNVTFSTVRRDDAGNYTVLANNFVIGSNVKEVGNDTGSFFLDVICKLYYSTIRIRQITILDVSSITINYS